jgi:arylsulfatase A-like enzyme
MAKRHFGVRTKRYKLIRFYHDIDAWELYDLEKDPLETSNLAGDPAHAEVRRALETELRRLQAFYRDSEELARRFVRADSGR